MNSKYEAPETIKVGTINHVVFGPKDEPEVDLPGISFPGTTVLDVD